MTCSTPCGITADGTRDDELLCEYVVPCSTPFGITADGTWLSRPFGAAWVEAQACSTPFGITADGTERSVGHVGRVDVLNAFRHHG